MSEKRHAQPGIVGDGLHDDAAGIQALLDDGRSLVYLPPPPVAYSIGKTLRIHSGQTLRLDRHTAVRLADGANTQMLTNADHAGGNRDIAVLGGVWDGNNRNQMPYPHSDPRGTYDPERYIGILFRFNHVRHLRIGGLTFKDPGAFATQMGNLTHFTIEDIVFDYNLAWPNMDGVHVQGNSRFGSIRNLHGTTNDDLVALNGAGLGQFEMVRGPISDVVVDGIFSNNGYTAVRLLSEGAPVSRIRLGNIFGTYRYYGVCLSAGPESVFEDILIDGVFCSKPLEPLANPLKDDHWGCGACPTIMVAPGVRVRDLTITNLHRTERYHRPPDTIVVGASARVDVLRISNSSFVNHSERERHFLVNKGEIGDLSLSGIRCRAEGGTARGLVLLNEGRVGRLGRSDVTVENFREQQGAG